ncbi:MAG: hypothetical protein ACOX2I_09640 [Candidatus Ozemobacteraceae bacterium]
MRPTEAQVELGGKDSLEGLTVYRLDMAAKVKTPEGNQLVIIEIQKAKFSTDIMRFRRYLGTQYSNSYNYEGSSFAESVADYAADANSKSSSLKDLGRALSIFSIYILGYPLATYPDRPVIKVTRRYTDNVTKEVLSEKDEFIKSLTHDSAIIQIPALKQRRRDRLEKVLAVLIKLMLLRRSCPKNPTKCLCASRSQNTYQTPAESVCH